MKQYHYFISYHYKNQDDNGFGQAILLLAERISGSDQIDQLVSYLKDMFGYKNVVILNFIFLKEEDLSISD